MKPKAKAASALNSGTAAMRRRNPLYFPVILALLALTSVVLRIVMSVEVVHTDPFAYNPPDVTDMATYHALSRGILNGVFPAEFVYQPFYYSVFLPAVKFLLRSEYLSVGIAQSVCVGIIVWFAGLTGAMLRSRMTGLLAAALCAFSTMLFFYVPYALIEVQQAMWFMLLLYFTLRAMKTGRAGFFAAAGLVLSFAILSRGNAWCFLPVLGFAYWTALRRKRFSTRRKAVLAAVLCLAAILLPQAPFAVKNTLATHSLSGPSTAGPAVLTLGNNPESPPGGLPVPYPPTYDEWMAHESEYSILRRIFDWFRAEPTAFLQLQAEKFFLFFDSGEIPNNIQLGVNAKESGVFRLFGFVHTGFVIALALAGFFLYFLRLKNHPGRLLLYLFLFLYALATVAFYVLARFRVPAIPFFAVGAALFVMDYIRAIFGGRGNRRRILLRFCPALLAGICFTVFFYPVYRYSYEAGLTKLTRPDGVRLETASMLLAHDNGPNYLDGWAAAKLDGGVTFSKTFSAHGIDLRKYANAYVTVSFFTEQPRKIEVVCNGKRETVSLAPHDLYRLPLIPVRLGPFPVPEDLTFTFSFPGLAPDHAGLAVDFHRDYGRTAYQGEVFPAEAVVRLELVEKDAPPETDSDGASR
ncbi:MAG: glycosyltransferase family 39 protein [Lentisphaeria bacterium]|nr:glycosyltransferase family 39 protein [Lentisphaeria bacterium]